MPYIFKRILFSVLMLFGITLIAFSISLAIPGNPADLILSGSNNVSYTQEELIKVKIKMGLDKTYAEQYITWTKNALRGNLGKSFATENNILEDIKTKFPQTFKLSLSSLALSLSLSIILATISILFKNSIIEKCIETLSIFFMSLPSFWIAIILMIIFSVKLKLLPTNGISSLKHYILPVITLSLSTTGTATRFIKSLIENESIKLYVLVAKSKGISNYYIVTRHIFPNISLPIIAYFGNYFSAILGGSMIIESVFSINGIGKYAIDSIEYLDYPALQAYVLITGLAYIIINLFIDIVYCFFNPKIRLGGNK